MIGGLNANIIIIGIIIFIVINIVIEASLIKCGHTMFKDKKLLTGFKKSSIVAINLSLIALVIYIVLIKLAFTGWDSNQIVKGEELIYTNLGDEFWFSI